MEVFVDTCPRMSPHQMRPGPRGSFMARNSAVGPFALHTGLSDLSHNLVWLADAYHGQIFLVRIGRYTHPRGSVAIQYMNGGDASSPNMSLWREIDMVMLGVQREVATGGRPGQYMSGWELKRACYRDLDAACEMISANYDSDVTVNPSLWEINRATMGQALFVDAASASLHRAVMDIETQPPDGFRSSSRSAGFLPQNPNIPTKW